MVSMTGLFLVVIPSLLSIYGLKSESKEIFNEYLKYPRMIAFSSYHRYNRKWLQSIEVKPNSDPQSVMHQLEAAGRATEQRFDRENYNKLVSLARSEPECRTDLIDFIISVYAQLERPRLEALEGFLDFYGQQKFKDCAIRVNDEIKKEPRAEYILDGFFKNRLRLQSDSSDSDVYHALRETSKKFHLAYYECQDLMGRFGTMLNIINLAKTLGSNVEPDVRLLKLNEYSRFCDGRAEA